MPIPAEINKKISDKIRVKNKRAVFSKDEIKTFYSDPKNVKEIQTFLNSYNKYRLDKNYVMTQKLPVLQKSDLYNDFMSLSKQFSTANSDELAARYVYPIRLTKEGYKPTVHASTHKKPTQLSSQEYQTLFKEQLSVTTQSKPTTTTTTTTQSKNKAINNFYKNKQNLSDLRKFADMLYGSVPHTDSRMSSVARIYFDLSTNYTTRYSQITKGFFSDPKIYAKGKIADASKYEMLGNFMEQQTLSNNKKKYKLGDTLKGDFAWNVRFKANYYLFGTSNVFLAYVRIQKLKRKRKLCICPENIKRSYQRYNGANKVFNK
tara:strand:+ start:605 stop:1558 length:954 start_codon:yes stop_codon:yes gene_type:complete